MTSSLLQLAVFGNMYGLANMSLFLIEINLLAALFAVQLVSGDVEAGNLIDFGTLYNTFLGIYQVFSSENWTDVLYRAAEPEVPLRQSAVVVLFFAGWMFFANCEFESALTGAYRTKCYIDIVLQMFIAVINENFDVAEESKRSRQASNYWASHRPQQARAAWIRKLNPYRWLKAQPKAIEVELPSNLVLPMQKALVQEYSLPKRDNSIRVRGYHVLCAIDADRIPTGQIHASRRRCSILLSKVDAKEAPTLVRGRHCGWRCPAHNSSESAPRLCGIR